MASGKSLELASIPKRTASVKCICGAPWDTHLRKDGETLARYNNDKHQAQNQPELSRRIRRRAFRG